MNLVKPSLLDVMYITHHLREWDRKELYATRFDEDPDRLAMDVMRWGPYWWVAGRENRAIAVIGATEVWPGRYTVGMFATDDFPQIGQALTRAVFRRIIPLLVGQGLKRAECKSIEGHDVAHRWLERLGAKRGEEMQDYGKGGESFFTYSWRF